MPMTALSGITIGGTLIAEADWKAMVMNLQAAAQPEIADEQQQIAMLRHALMRAVKQRVSGLRRFGILLSGGVDSSLLALLCKQLEKEFTCYTVGLAGSSDILAAQRAAELLDLKLVQRTFTMEELEPLFRRVAEIVPRADAVSIGVGAVELAAIELAKSDGTCVLMGGLGSEEIFAGYERHAQAAEVNAECWNGLFNMHTRDLQRGAALSTALGVQFLTPFLDPAVITVAMRIPGSAKIAQGEKKVILRKAAEALGLPKEIAWRKKQAAQYGSKFDAVLEKLAKQAGMGKQGYVAGLTPTARASPTN